MKRRNPAGLVVVMLTVGCSAVPAPDLSPPGPQTAAAALRGLARGREVRLHRADGSELRGRVQFTTRDSAGIATGVGPEIIELVAVDTVWVHRDPGRTAGAGVLYGAAAGAALAALLLAANCHACDDPGLGRAMAPYGFVLATSVGALLGSVGGAVAPEWARIFPAIRSPRPW